MDAIQQLHHLGVVHRDIKPENLRVKDGKPVLIDFGIASWWDSRSNIIPTGTKFYSPPEIVCIFDEFKRLKAAREANKKLIEIIPDNAKERIKYIKKLHDVYSLGITIGELLTGSLPFNRTSYVEYLDKGGCEAMTKWLDRLPAKYRTFILRSTAFYPDQRPQIDDLLPELDIKTDLHRPLPLPEEDGDIYFQEGYYRCLKCGKETLPPANFCPYCGEELSQVILEIEPDQSIDQSRLPEAVHLEQADQDPESGPKIAVDLNGEDFTISMGRSPDGNNLAFPDDNWMSGLHGELTKEGDILYYSDGKEGRPPTNPSSVNNIPAGKSRMELFSGSFLLMGSTVFHIKKYFGKIQTGSAADATV